MRYSPYQDILIYSLVMPSLTCCFTKFKYVEQRLRTIKQYQYMKQYSCEEMKILGNRKVPSIGIRTIR